MIALHAKMFAPPNSSFFHHSSFFLHNVKYWCKCSRKNRTALYKQNFNVRNRNRKLTELQLDEGSKLGECEVCKLWDICNHKLFCHSFSVNDLVIISRMEMCVVVLYWNKLVDLLLRNSLSQFNLPWQSKKNIHVDISRSLHTIYDTYANIQIFRFVCLLLTLFLIFLFGDILGIIF